MSAPSLSLEVGLSRWANQPSAHIPLVREIVALPARRWLSDLVSDLTGTTPQVKVSFVEETGRRSLPLTLSLIGTPWRSMRAVPLDSNDPRRLSRAIVQAVHEEFPAFAAASGLAPRTAAGPCEVVIAGPAPSHAPAGLGSQWFADAQARLFADLGVSLAIPRLAVDATLAQNEARLTLNGVRSAPAAATGWHPVQLLDAVMPEMRRRARELVSTEGTEERLSLMSGPFPDLVEEVRARFDTATLVEVARGLVEEGVSLVDLRSIAEALLETRGRIAAAPGQSVLLGPAAGTFVLSARPAGPVDAADLLAAARSSLGRRIVDGISGGARVLNAITLDPALERGLLDEPAGPAGAVLVEWLTAINVLTMVRPTPVLLVHQACRRLVWTLVHGRFPLLRVLCREEVAAHAQLRIIARVQAERPIRQAPKS